MNKNRATKLEHKLTRRMLQVQLIALALFFGVGVFPWVIYPTLSYLGDMQPLDPRAAIIFARSLEQGEGDQILVRPNEALSRIVAEYPNIWLYARTEAGASATLGNVPPQYRSIEANLWTLEALEVRLSGSTQGGAFLHTEISPVGPVKVMTGNGPVLGVGSIVQSVTIYVALGIFGILVVVSAVAIPLIVRRELRGIETAAEQAQLIDVDTRGTRLPTHGVPDEVRSLVNAVNDALARLDDSHEKRERFLADSAHELRTPIAILQARIETAPPFPAQGQLSLDVARLASLAGQLLDLQRMDLAGSELAPIDIADMAGDVVADLAPLAIAAGYELSLAVPDKPVIVNGDRSSLMRALTNLIQNAIAYGGQRGEILASVSEDGKVAISDDGPGIPAVEREKVFDPFYRLQPSATGAGLGLNLVDAIIRRHGGQVSIEEAESGGARFVVSLPLLKA